MNDLKDQQLIEKTINKISVIYSALTDECKSDLAHSSKVFSVEKAKNLVKAGQNADKMYFLMEGCIRVYYLKDGKDISDWFAFENEFVCSINSFFLSIPSPHYLQTLEPTTYLEISRETAFRLMEKHHCFETLARKTITQITLQLQSRIVSHQFETAHQKYDNLLQSRKDITQRVPLSHIASYLGITLETLSRIRNPKKRI